MSDQGPKVEKLVKDLFLTLDKQYSPSTSLEQYTAEILPQLKQSSSIIINGNPILGRQNFQKIWITFPIVQHSITSIDFHSISGLNQIIINFSGKLRFDESGKNKLGETAEINSNGSGFINTNRNLWGSWIGFNAQLIIDEQGLINFQSEFINSLNWKIVYQPEDSMITI